ncbi:hypothetical protein D5E78_31275, partial [Vibrio parahaemolyticus]
QDEYGYYAVEGVAVMSTRVGSIFSVRFLTWNFSKMNMDTMQSKGLQQCLPEQAPISRLGS